MPRLPLLAALVSLAATLHAADVHVRVDPSARMAAPGNENLATFPTIVNALDHHPFATPNPDGTPGRVFIEIVPGIYHERVIVTQNHNNITLIGLGKTPDDVVITNSLNARTAGGTFFTETVEINGTGFEADNITFENAAGNTGQAVAVLPTAATAASSSTAASSGIKTRSSPTTAASTTSTPTSKAASTTSSATPPPSSSATNSTPTAPASSLPSRAPRPISPPATSSSTPASPPPSTPPPRRPTPLEPPAPGPRTAVSSSAAPGVPTPASSL
jgi:hypothetical protein